MEKSLYWIDYLTPDGVQGCALTGAESKTGAYLNAIFALPLNTIILNIFEI